MGKIKKLYARNFNELTESSDTEIYPITSFKSVFDTQNRSLNNIIDLLQYKTDSSLQTNAKTIIGAINELKNSIGQGGGSSGSIDLSNYITKNGNENIGGYKTYYGTSKFTGTLILPINAPSSIEDTAFYIGNIGFDASSPSTGGGGEVHPYYTFLDGQDGSFQVILPGGMTRTVLIGKPATAGTADKLGTTTVGSATVPIYLNNGIPTECNLSSSSTPGTNVYWENKNTDNHSIDLIVGDNNPETLVLWSDTLVTTNTNQTISADKTFTNKIDFTGTLILPVSTPSVLANEVALYINDIGFDASSPSTSPSVGTNVSWGNEVINKSIVLDVGGTTKTLTLFTATEALQGYFTEGVANDALKLGGIPASDYVTIYNDQIINGTKTFLGKINFKSGEQFGTFVLPTSALLVSEGETAIYIGETGFDV